MINIAIIGAGNIGSRHLQALAKLEFKLNIFVVDPNPISIKTSRERYNEVATNQNIKVTYHDSIILLPSKLDLVIIATTSEYRYLVLEEIVQNFNIDYIIFEKFLFQKLSEYKTAKNLLKNNKIKAWVNCWPRITNIFQELKESLDLNSIVSINVYGSNWGLASNSIHFIDLFNYLIGGTNNQIIKVIKPTVYVKKTSEGIVKEKFFDLSGSIVGLFNRIPYSIISYNKGVVPLTVEVVSEESVQTINLDTKTCSLSSLDNDWKSESYNIEIPHQSDQTYIHVEKILKSNECDLCKYDLSFDLHYYFLNYLIKHFENTDLVKGNKCLIT